jgi:hypothetical protein
MEQQALYQSSSYRTVYRFECRHPDCTQRKIVAKSYSVAMRHLMQCYGVYRYRCSKCAYQSVTCTTGHWVPEAPKPADGNKSLHLDCRYCVKEQHCVEELSIKKAHQKVKKIMELHQIVFAEEVVAVETAAEHSEEFTDDIKNDESQKVLTLSPILQRRNTIIINETMIDNNPSDADVVTVEHATLSVPHSSSRSLCTVSSTSTRNEFNSSSSESVATNLSNLPQSITLSPRAPTNTDSIAQHLIQLCGASSNFTPEDQRNISAIVAKINKQFINAREVEWYKHLPWNASLLVLDTLTQEEHQGGQRNLWKWHRIAMLGARYKRLRRGRYHKAATSQSMTMGNINNNSASLHHHPGSQSTFATRTMTLYCNSLPKVLQSPQPIQPLLQPPHESKNLQTVYDKLVSWIASKERQEVLSQIECVNAAVDILIAVEQNRSVPVELSACPATLPASKPSNLIPLPHLVAVSNTKNKYTNHQLIRGTKRQKL